MSCLPSLTKPVPEAWAQRSEAPLISPQERPFRLPSQAQACLTAAEAEAGTFVVDSDGTPLVIAGGGGGGGLIFGIMPLSGGGGLTGPDGGGPNGGVNGNGGGGGTAFLAGVVVAAF